MPPSETSLRKLFLLKLAEHQIPLAPGRTLEMVLGCALVELADGRRILIDSGISRLAGPAGEPGAEPARTAVEALAAIGVAPETVSTLLLTHLDVDHVGGLAAFPHAELLMQRAAWEAAQTGADRYRAARLELDRARQRLRLLEGDLELEPGLLLVFCPGHAAGQQSVLLRLPRAGALLLASDAVPLERMFTAERGPWALDDDLETARASTRRLIELAARQRALVVFGHDGWQWRTLRLAPEFYD
jgi:N-acyl homoserine lactone hydrolase